MKTFTSLRTKVKDRSQDLYESLNTAVDFYMTDDTVMPKRIYGAFELDGIRYGISIEETNFAKVYELRFYRIVNSKARRWSFFKASHVRPCLSTVLKFGEAVIPFLNERMDGMIIAIPGKIESEKYNRFLEMIVKKSYVSTFKAIPVKSDNTKQQSYNHIFIARKAKNPATIFSSKSFSKYTWVGPKNYMPAEAAEDVKPKKPVEKKIFSTNPSPKWSFKSFELQDVSDSLPKEAEELVNLPKKIKIVDKEHAHLDGPDLITAINAPKEKPVAQTTSVSPKGPSLDGIKIYDKNLSAFIVAEPEFKKMANILSEKGYNEDSFDNIGFNSRVAKTVYLKYILKMLGYVNDDFKLLPAGQEPIKIALQNIAYKKSTESSTYLPKGILMDVQKIASAYEDHEKTVKKEKIFSTNKLTGAPALTIIDENFPFESLKVNIPGTGKLVYRKTLHDQREEGEDSYAKVNHIKKLGYDNFWSSGIKDGKTQGIIKSYTGSDYGNINGELRKAFNEPVAKTLNGSDVSASLSLNDDSYEFEQIHKAAIMMKKGFDNVKPIPDNLWVYRGCSIKTKLYPEEKLQPGNLFFDPAFQSTSLNSQNNFGLDNAKLRIFIPKGSKVVPVISSYTSYHDHEKEIILPASSVLRIIRFDKFNTYGEPQYYLTCVYTGHIFYDLIKKLKINTKYVETAITSIDTPPHKVQHYVSRMKKVEEFNKLIYGEQVKEGYLHMNENRYNSKKDGPKKPEKYDPNKKFGGEMNADAASAVKKLIKAKKVKLKP